MPVDEPSWWYAEGDRRAAWLAPIARVWGRVAERRFEGQAPYRSRLPVICVGNFTAGGTGKTPLSLHIVALLRQAGETPVLLTRGYGGALAGPVWVEPQRHEAADVGDEPLLLARSAPVMVARDRRLGALAIEAGDIPPGAIAMGGGSASPDAAYPLTPSVIVMDDGLQNPALAKDLSIVLVDGTRGVGNGRVIPAGPLRAPLEFQLRLADAIVVVGGGDSGNQPGEQQAATATPDAGKPAEVADDAPATAPADPGALSPKVLQSLRLGFPGPVLTARQVPAADTAWLHGLPVLAYAGIGNPDRFFRLLQSIGANITGRCVFKDHHTFDDADAARLLDKATQGPATLVTTEKDWVRLARAAAREPRSARARLAAASRVLPIAMQFDDASAARLADLVLTAARTGGYRRALMPDPSASRS